MYGKLKYNVQPDCSNQFITAYLIRQFNREVMWYHFTAVSLLIISFLAMALSHWHPYKTWNNNGYIVYANQLILS